MVDRKKELLIGVPNYSFTEDIKIKVKSEFGESDWIEISYVEFSMIERYLNGEFALNHENGQLVLESLLSQKRFVSKLFNPSKQKTYDEIKQNSIKTVKAVMNNDISKLKIKKGK